MLWWPWRMRCAVASNAARWSSISTRSADKPGAGRSTSTTGTRPGSSQEWSPPVGLSRSPAITEPDYGVIFDDMFFDDGGVVPFTRFIRPRVEVELAFILDQPLEGPGVSMLDVLDATRWVTPALEILDARVQMSDPEHGHLRTIVDTISDNAADAGIVVGGRAVRPDALDLRRVGAALYVNEAIEETGLAAGVLGHPANGVAWLANKLDPYDEFLPPRQDILPGSSIPY